MGVKFRVEESVGEGVDERLDRAGMTGIISGCHVAKSTRTLQDHTQALSFLINGHGELFRLLFHRFRFLQSNKVECLVVFYTNG